MAEQGLCAARLPQAMGTRQLLGRFCLDGGCGLEGSDGEGIEGPGSSSRRLQCGVGLLRAGSFLDPFKEMWHRYRLFLPLPPPPTLVPGAVSPLPSCLHCCAGTGYSQHFPPGQGSRAGHDLTPQPWPRWGCPTRPGLGVSSTLFPEAAPNQTAGLERSWFSSNNSLLAMPVSAETQELGACCGSLTSGS